MKIPLRALPLLGLTSVRVGAHTRLECPPPRSGETGAKAGPCDAPDDPSLPAHPLQPGAFNTITWLESIAHPGAPARLALSLDGDDSASSFESCLLLDHIPHDEYSAPRFTDPLSWHRSSITIWVPDVKCERCHLQLMTVMSDELHGVPEGTSCAYGGALAAGTVGDGTLPACPIVYHSCAPVSIDGAIPRNEATCDTADFEEKLGWMRRPGDSDASYYDRSTYYYKGDPGLYDLTTSRLMMAGPPIEGCESVQFCDPDTHVAELAERLPEDAAYASLVGTCAATVGMEVEAFAPGGILPSTPKDPSTTPEPPTRCSVCEAVGPCYSAPACSLRDRGTGAWGGAAAYCNFGDSACEACFPDSPCVGYGSDGGDGAAEDDAKDGSVEGGDAGDGDGAAGDDAKDGSVEGGAVGDGVGAASDGAEDASAKGDVGEGGGANAEEPAPGSGGGLVGRSRATVFLSVALGAVAAKVL